MWVKEICVVLLLAVSLCNAASRDRNNKDYKVVCYLGTWANYRQGEAKFLIEDIDPFLCTHIVYGFAKLAGNKIAAYDPYLDLKENWGLGAYERFNNLKKKNPNLTTILAIGGWNEGSTKYSDMAKYAATRATFVQSCVDFLLKYDFDGLDMDWEYPANRGGVPEDKQNFILLLKDLKEAFEPHGLLVTAAVAAGKATMDSAYDIPEMGRYLDIINVMAYDLHGSWEKFTGHNAPLFKRPDETGDQTLLNVDYATRYWIDKGAPPSKLVLGMALYGRSFTLEDANKNGLGAPATGPGSAGPMTKEPGMLGFNEICNSLTRDTGWTSVYDENHKAPYAYKDRQWVGYDDVDSIKTKVDYLKEMKLGGGMVWSLETDDFRGKCYGHKYPLLSVIAENLNGPITRETVQPEERTTGGPGTTRPPVEITTKVGDTTLTCNGAGHFRHPDDCNKYYQCVPSGDGYQIYVFDCPSGLAFDESTNTCNYPNLVDGCH